MVRLAFHLERQHAKPDCLMVDFWLESAKTFAVDEVFIINLSGKEYSPPPVSIKTTVLEPEDKLPSGTPVYLMPKHSAVDSTVNISSFKPKDDAIYIFGTDSPEKPAHWPRENDITLTLKTPSRYPLWSFAAFIVLMTRLNK